MEPKIVEIQPGQRVIAFTRVKRPWGWLGNMTRHRIEYEGEIWPSPEALFQALRFPLGSIRREEIRAIENPFSAKVHARMYVEEMTLVKQSEQDLDNMRMILRQKIAQNRVALEIQIAELIASDDSLIIEDCTKRPHGSGLFWGAECLDLQGRVWRGENWLGRLWMELRAELRQEAGDHEREWLATANLS